MSQQLCSSVADQLTRTADSVVQLYKRLALEGNDSASTMLQALEEAVGEAQRTLQLVAARDSDSTKVLDSEQQGREGVGDQKNMVVMMQQYSDMLLSMVQQRMTTVSQQKPS